MHKREFLKTVGGASIGLLIGEECGGSFCVPRADAPAQL